MNNNDDLPKRRRWPMQFTIRTLLLLAFPAALIGYLLKPGHLLKGNVKLEFRCIEGRGPGRMLMADGSYQRTMQEAKIEITNKSGNTLWYTGAAEYPTIFFVDSLVDEKWMSIGVWEEQHPKIAFSEGETITINAPVYENATAVRISIQFFCNWFNASSWVKSDIMKFEILGNQNLDTTKNEAEK
jgi:hypothetical protein